MNSGTQDLLERFEAGRLEPAAFDHRAHLEVAFAMLEQLSFLETAVRYANGIRGLAEAAGAPEKFNLTITIAFLSLIAERRSLTPDSEFDEFLGSNPDLLDGQLLRSWYSPERLETAGARNLFLLPDASQPGAA